MTAVDKSASDKANPTGEARAAKLIAWFNADAGGKIKWGTPGDFDACVRIAGKHMRPDQAKGFCALRHKDATGAWPGKAPGERAAGKVKKAGRLAVLRRLLSLHPATKTDCPSCGKPMSAFAGVCPSCGAGVGVAAKELGMKTSAMVALYPEPHVAAALALDGGELPEALHVTLGFLGSDAVVRLDRDRIEAALAAFAANNLPVDGVVGGLARFNAPAAGEPWPLVALVDAPNLTEFRQRLVGTLAAAGVSVSTTHGYTAHCTLALVKPDDEEAAAAILAEGIESTPLHFGTVVLAWGDDRTVYRLEGNGGPAQKAIAGARTFDEKRELVNRALKLAYGAAEDTYLYVSDLTDEWAVFDLGGKTADAGLYRVRYVIGGDSDEVYFGDPEAVERKVDYVMKATAGTVIKSDEARRYTLMPLYPASPESPSADHLDAHGDFATADDVQTAVWDYVRKGDRTIRDQHRDGTAIGECVELMCWPHEVTVPMTKADGTTAEKTFGAGTAFMGVVWSAGAWEDVKKGRKTGLSLGGVATRVAVEMNG